MDLVALTLRSDALGSVARGHPWVYSDGLRDTPHDLAPGTTVLLSDEKGKPAAFGLWDGGDIAVRVLGRHPEPIDALLRTRVRAASDARVGPSGQSARLVPMETDAYRVVNGEGDRLPGLVVDRYADLLVLRLYSKAWEPHLEGILAVLRELPGVRSIARKLGVRNVDGREGLELLDGPEPAAAFVVREAGAKFLVRPAVGQKTGLFLDQREHRLRVALHAHGATVLNLFCYTGGFSVHAALAGARRTVSVDIAEDALEDARENFRLNGLDPHAHEFYRRDAFQFSHPDLFSLVICDPPSLARDQEADAAAAKAYKDLAMVSGRLVAPGGLLATASCTSRLPQDRWEQTLRDGLRKVGRWAWLWRAAEPPDHPVLLDHPEGRYLKFAMLTRHT